MRAWSRFLLAAVVVVAASCTTAPRQERTPLGEVKIGLLAPLSGPNAAAGADALHGAEFAAGLLNGQGGSVRMSDLGLQEFRDGAVKIIPANATNNPDTAATAAVRLTAQQVVGLVGAYAPDVTAAASQRTERLSIPFLNGDSAAGFLTERGLDWFFRTGPTDRLLSEADFSALKRKVGVGARRIGILYADDAPSNGAAATASTLADEGGYEVVPRGGVSFAPGAGPNPAASVQRIRAERPDAVFLVATSTVDAQKIVRAFGTPGYRPPTILGLGAGFQPAALKAVGPAADGLLFSTGWAPEAANRNPAAAAIMDLYQQQFHGPMSGVAAGTFTAVLTLATAIEDAGSVDNERVRAALLSLDIPGRGTIMPWDGIRFDATHQNSRATGVVEQQLPGGTTHVVFPPELGTNA